MKNIFSFKILQFNFKNSVYIVDKRIFLKFLIFLNFKNSKFYLIMKTVDQPYWVAKERLQLVEKDPTFRSLVLFSNSQEINKTAASW